MKYTIDDIFAPSSPAFTGAPFFRNTPGSQNAFTEAVSPNAIGDGQSGENLKNFGLNSPFITAFDTDSIQKSLEKLRQIGGGTISLLVGASIIQVSLTGYSSISIVGISPSATVLNFNSTSANLSFSGTNVYATGTITSITSGVSVVGSGTSWLTNATAGQAMFIGTRWYTIAAVVDDTHITLAEAYIDNVTMPGASYRIAYPIVDITIKNITLKNSTGTGLVVTDARKVILDNVLSLTNNKGYTFTNVSEFSMDRVLAIANTSNGLESTSVGLCDWKSINCIGNGGSGMVLNTVKTLSIYPSACNANAGDGVNITSCTDVTAFFEASGNGGQGIELVSGNDNVTIFNGPISGNASDGIKLTASSDNCKIYGNKITGNGGYGVNIADSSCDNNLIVINTFATNSSGAINDSGTGTVIGLNPGV